MQALREIGVEPAVVSTRLPHHSLISHPWAAEAQRDTEYLFPPKVRSVLGAFWTLLRAGPAGWWRASATLVASEGSFLARIRLLLLMLVGAELAWLARRKGWTHVHVHSCGNAANIAMFARRLTGLPYSLTLHGRLRDYGPNQKQKWVHSAFALVVTRTLREEVRKELAGFLPPEIELAPMGVDLKRFQKASPYLPWPGSGPLRLFSCGRLNPYKGHDDLLRAVAQLRRQGMDARLTIAGEDDVGGACRQGLETLSRELGLGDNLKLLGAVSEDEVHSQLSAAHAFVLASLDEALGVATMEAMALQVPVVVTGVGGVPELVDDEVNGILVPPRAPEKMAEALLRLLGDPGLAAKLSQAGRTKIESSFHSGVSAATLRRCVESPSSVRAS